MIDKKQTTRKILMTISLPYANGALHLGHLIEAIQADIWARWQRLMGNDCLFISGNDAHGTAIMLSAEQHGVSAETWIKKIHADDIEDYQSFLVDFDHFYTTHSPENKILSEQIFQRLQQHGDIKTRTISQAFDPVKNMFLSDRFIRGTCPKCGATNQYGDNCEVCGATYSPLDLKDAVSALSNAKPIIKESTHFFFELENYREFLTEWVSDQHLQPPVVNKLKEWFKEGLKAWNISRDAPYFGFEIPGAPGKYFYVWLDAPIGYIANLKNYCITHPEINFEDYWLDNDTTDLYHFIGKDVVYFHALFWPAMLKGAHFRLPTRIFVHGFLTINGQKMSKSRGTFITAKQYLTQLDPEYLRYYFAVKLTGEVEDIDLNFNDFMARINSDLVGKFVNLASRCAGFIVKNFSGQLADQLPEPELFDYFVNAGDRISQYYEQLKYNRAMQEIMSLADKANQYIDQQKPWALAKQADQQLQVQAICTQGLNLFKLLATYLQPVLPATTTKITEFLNISELSWLERKQKLVRHQINPFQPLMQRVDSSAADALGIMKHE